jgi:Lon protease-like protein
VARDQRFGVVLIRTGPEVGGLAQPYTVGTVAHIRAQRELGEGRLMLLVVGEQRFRILDAWEQDERLVAQVTWVRDEPVPAEAAEALSREVCDLALEHFRLVREAVGRSFGDPVLPSEPELLGFFLAANLRLSPLERQALLELDDTVERLRRVRAGLRQEVSDLGRQLGEHEQTEHVRGSNGKLDHGHHLTRDLLAAVGRPPPAEDQA